MLNIRRINIYTCLSMLHVLSTRTDDKLTLLSHMLYCVQTENHDKFLCHQNSRNEQNQIIYSKLNIYIIFLHIYKSIQIKIYTLSSSIVVDVF